MKYYIVSTCLILINLTIYAQSTLDPFDLLVGTEFFPNSDKFEPLMFYKEGDLTGALRAGWITDDSWDAGNLGIASVGIGLNAKAKGNYSAAFGSNTESLANMAFSCGDKSVASGFASFAGGINSIADTDGGFAFGRGAEVDENGAYGAAFGDSTIVTGRAAFASGKFTRAQTDYSQAFGFKCTTGTPYSTAFGEGNFTYENHMFVVGRHNKLVSVLNNGGGSHLFVVGNGTQAINSNALVVTTGARVGIGVDDPCQALDVAGNVSHSGVVACSSDERFKKNITPLESSLDTLLKIQPVRYHLRTEEFPEKQFSQDRQLGFIAQEIQAYFPEIVIEDSKGYLAVDYSKMTPVLLSGIQDLIRDNARLASQLDQQSKLLNRLEARIKQIEKINLSSNR